MNKNIKVTISDIAREAGVSKMTVSRVINDASNVAQKTRTKIQKLIKEMDYQPNLIARSLSNKRTMTIGILVPKREKIFLDNYIAQILAGVSEIIKKHDYRIMLFPIDIEDDSGYVSIVRGNLIDGLILLKISSDDTWINSLAEIDFPFVFVNHRREDEKFNFVDSENKKGIKLAVDYLYSLGRRDFAFVAGSMNETNGVDRLNGFKEALKDKKLIFNDEWIIKGEFNKDIAFENSAKLFIKKKKPDAIICSDDYMAIGVIDRIIKEGFRVPQDFSVIGFDDIEIASYINPALTTIRQPLHELGVRAASILLNIINKRNVNTVHEFLEVELIKRDSC